MNDCMTAEVAAVGPAAHTESSLSAAIHKTWPSHGDRPRFVTAFQVHNGAGFSYHRRLDAVVFDTWPSGGLGIQGFEIKCSAGDMRRELQDTTKFAEFAPFLDRFSIIAPAGIVKLEMLPATWGLYCPTPDGSLKARRLPLMLHDGRDTKTMARTFAAAFVRALIERSLSKEAEQNAFQRGSEDADSRRGYELDRVKREQKQLAERVEQFEQASGIDITRHFGRSEKIGTAVKFVLDGGLDGKLGYARDLHSLATNLEQLATELDALKPVLSFGEALVSAS